eukprot:scaffold78565_cov20-Cyclotella_meneghiniana.AAC.1
MTEPSIRDSGTRTNFTEWEHADSRMVMFILEIMKAEEDRDRGNAFLPMEVSVEGVFSVVQI